MFTSVRGNVTLILLSFLMNMYHHDSSLGIEATVLSFVSSTLKWYLEPLNLYIQNE